MAKSKKTKEMIPYILNIAWSQEDQCYVARFPELPGCMTHGDTQEEALKHAHEALKGYLATCKKEGVVLPSPVSLQEFSGTFSARVGPDLHRKLAMEAAQMNKSITDLVKEKLSA